MLLTAEKASCLAVARWFPTLSWPSQEGMEALQAFNEEKEQWLIS